MLFSIWKKYRDTQEDTDSNDVEGNGDQTQDAILELDPESDSSNLDLFPPIQQDSTNQAVHLDTNNPELQQNMETVELSETALMPPLHPTSLVLATSGSGQVLQVPSTPILMKTPQTSRKTPEDIWREHLSWPEISREQSNLPRKNTKRKIPFAMTSKKWQDIHEAERIAKENKEQLKKQRREEREAKKKKNDNRCKRKKENTKKKA